MCVAAGLSDEMPLSRRAIQGNSCKSVCRGGKCAVPAPVLPATHGIVSKSVCRGGLERSMSLLVLRYTVCEVKVCVAKGSVMKCPLPVVRYRVIRAKVCVAEGMRRSGAGFPSRYRDLFWKVCVAGGLAGFRRGCYGKKKDVRKRKRS